MTAARDTTARYAGLDGLRAVAVGLVLVYHLFPGILPGGYVGVDVFFVVSGFLITTLMLHEHVARRASLTAFWRRRARRLLPALAAMITVCASLAALVGGDVLFRLGAQVAGAATFSYNWWAIAAGTGYFDASAPEIFRNVWSLAVEEQFYIVWPLVLPLFFLLRRTWMLVATAIVLAAASAGHMFVLLAQGAGIARVYYGTDTHAFGLLLGAATAFALAPLLTRAREHAARAAAATTHVRYIDVPPRPAVPGPTDDTPVSVMPAGWTIVVPPSARPAPPRGSAQTPLARGLLAVLGAAALAGLIALSVLPASADAVAHALPLVAASVLAAIAVVASVWPGSPLGRLLDMRALAWIGERSYGLYLWHWPLLILAVYALGGAGSDPDVPPGLGIAVLTATVATAAASYRWLEMPVRRHGLRGAAVLLWARLRSSGRQQVRAVTALATALAVVAGTGAAITAAPDLSSAEAAVAAGQAALDGAGAAADPRSPAATAAPAQTEAAPSVRPTPAESTASFEVPGNRIDAIGDSVMLASAGALLEGLPGIRVDAAVSRSMWAGPGIVQTLADTGTLRKYVVVALGTNGAVDEASLERILSIIGPSRTLVLVTAFAPRGWIAGVNADLSAFARAHRNVVLADWSGAISAHTGEIAGDGIHPGGAGARRFADVVADAVQQAQRQRLDQARRVAAALPAAREDLGLLALR